MHIGLELHSLLFFRSEIVARHSGVPLLCGWLVLCFVTRAARKSSSLELRFGVSSSGAQTSSPKCQTETVWYPASALVVVQGRVVALWAFPGWSLSLWYPEEAIP